MKYQTKDMFWDFWLTSTEQCFDEIYITYKGEDVNVETSVMYATSGCNEIFEFRVYAYSEVRCCYDQDITDQLSEYDNLAFQRLIYDHAADEEAARWESRHERGYDR